jgi:copper chaperone
MYQFHVPGMTCGGCARAVTNAIKAIDPAAEVTTDPPGRSVTVQSQADEQALVSALSEAGYRAERKDQSAAA